MTYRFCRGRGGAGSGRGLWCRARDRGGCGSPCGGGCCGCVVFALVLLGSVVAVLVISPVAFAQSLGPDAPTAVAVYSVKSEKLEVRWSSSDAVDHVVQGPVEIGKRGVRLVPAAIERSGDEHRKRAVDLGRRPVQGRPHGAD